MYRIFNVNKNKWLNQYYVDDYNNTHASYTADIRLSLACSDKLDAMNLAKKLGCIAYAEDEAIIRVDWLDHNGNLQINWDEYVVVKRDVATDESAVLELMQDYIEVDYNDYVEVELTDIEYEVVV